MSDQPGAADAGNDREAERAINSRIFETSLDLILVVDRKGTFIRVSPSVRTIVGFAPEELIGRSAVDFIYPDDLEHTRDEMRQIRRGQLTRNFDCRYVHQKGHPVPITWTGVWSEPGRQFFFIGRDMTERIRLEQQLRHAQKMDAVGQLTGGVAHDFNNILAVAIGMVELLREHVARDPQARAMVDTIDEAMERGSQLTQRLLAFSRRQPLQARALDLNDVISRSARMLRRTLREDIAVRTVLAEELWPALADPSQVEDALLNLAVNARDAMPNGGRLVLETANVHLDEEYAAQNVEAVAGDYVAITVTDSGAGMEPEVAERAFEPFFTTKEVGIGTGLGLSMVYGFVKQSRGHVKIYSEVGQGTSVKIYLPRLVAADVKDDAGQPAKPDARAVGRETILVVEDAAPVRTMAINMLKSLGYQVHAAEDGPSALRILDATPDIDLLFTDVIMPNGMSGLDLIRAARARRADLKVLITSGYSEHFIEGRAGSELDLPLVRKPYRRQKLAEAVRSVLDGTA